MEKQGKEKNMPKKIRILETARKLVKVSRMLQI